MLRIIRIAGTWLLGAAVAAWVALFTIPALIGPMTSQGLALTGAMVAGAIALIAIPTIVVQRLARNERLGRLMTRFGLYHPETGATDNATGLAVLMLLAFALLHLVFFGPLL